eukprot:4693244-Karenia_brevis.AAC.1
MVPHRLSILAPNSHTDIRGVVCSQPCSQYTLRIDFLLESWDIHNLPQANCVKTMNRYFGPPVAVPNHR